MNRSKRLKNVSHLKGGKPQLFEQIQLVERQSALTNAICVDFLAFKCAREKKFSRNSKYFSFDSPDREHYQFVKAYPRGNGDLG